MIESITIKNFQSHKHSKLLLHKGVNVIVGSSDSGKTSVVRAFNWVKNNKPSGKAFVRHNSSENMEVIIKTEDSSVRRVRTLKGENFYDLDGEQLKAIGKEEPPDKVKQALDISPISIQSQMDTPFLLSSSSGEVARVLNEIVDLDIIDKVYATCASKIRAINSSLKFEEERKEELEKESLSEYTHLDKMESVIQKAEKKALLLEKLNGKHSVLEYYCQSRKEILSEVVEYNETIKIHPFIQGIEKKLVLHASSQRSYDDLTLILSKIELEEEAIVRYQSISTLEEVVLGIEIKLAKVKKLAEAYAKITYSAEKLIQQIAECEEFSKELKTLESSFKKEMPDMCPLCGEQSTKPKMKRKH